MTLIPINMTSNAPSNGINFLKTSCPPTDNIALAKYCMVGDFPSNVEVLEEEPFKGPPGAQLNRICASVQIPRHEIYLTLACKAQLPKNNVNKLWTAKGFRCADWGMLQKKLLEELSAYTGTVIVTLGDTATLMILDSFKFKDIAKFRGSFYRTNDFPHLRSIIPDKIIMPSYHPSYTLPYKNPVHFYTMIIDMQRMINVSQDQTILDHEVELITRPDFNKIMEFFELVKLHDIIAFDIEATPEFITCFSIAIRHKDSSITSMSIPLMDNKGNYWTIPQEVEIWTQLALILADPKIRIVCQNGMFDLTFVLRTMNIISDNFYFDTMLAQHLVYTELPKGLDYLTSVYTYFPYYKDEGKQSHLTLIKDWDSYWAYNAKDSAYLFEIMDNLLIELKSFESLDAMQYQMELHKPLIEMEFNGILTDQEGIKKYKEVLTRRIYALQHGLNKITGKELNINSSKQLIAYFYGTLMLKPYINPKTKNATCNTVALHRIAKKGKKGAMEARMIIKMRTYFKLVSTYFSITVDADNRLRCNHKIAGTVSGRIATNKTFFGTGANLQNQPYVYKKYLMAD